jgi:hypothetical protein
VLPNLDPETGLLPVGEHHATWDEVVEQFGWNEKRRGLLDGLADGLELLEAAGCSRVWLDGSFVTAKDEPDDFDACWESDSVDLEKIDPVFLDLSDGRDAQKRRFGGEFFPNVIESGSGLVFAKFFQNERDGSHKGIVVLSLGGPT